MRHSRLNFFFLNIGHLFDHYFVLIFATVAALTLANDWQMSYAELIPFATPGFIAFGIFAIPAGWIADKWDRQHMMVIFFVGIGLSAIVTAMSQTPIQIGLGLFIIGGFAAIYHPVGLALVIEGHSKTGVILAVNGIWGNLGVGVAAAATGILIDFIGWRAAFIIPGILSVGTGIVYYFYNRRHPTQSRATKNPIPNNNTGISPIQYKDKIAPIFAIIFFSSAIGGLTYQSTTFALPKIFDERLTELATSATSVGLLALLVFSIAAISQLIVGYFTDRFPIRYVFSCVALTQVIFLFSMQGLTDLSAFIVAVLMMMAVFGQIPINDVLVGRVTTDQWRSRVYAARYLVTFSAMAITLPLLAWFHNHWGFDGLFLVLSLAALAMLCAVLTLPNKGVVVGERI
jgi:MFS family permease